MKHWHFLVPVTIAISTSVFAGGHREPSQAQSNLVDRVYSDERAPVLRVATFNIAAARVSSLTEIAKAINAIDADILALQEIDVLTGRSGSINQAQELAKLTGLNIEFGRAIDFDGGSYGLAIASKYPILKSNILKLPSGNREQRIAFEAFIDVPGFEAPIIIFNTHLDTKEDPQMRIDQVRKLNDAAIDMRGIKILLGDMNDVPNSATFQELSRYWSNISEKNTDFRSWPSINPEIQVDYIMTSKAQKWTINNIIVPHNAKNYARIDWPAVTDHLPIIVDMKMIEQ